MVAMVEMDERQEVIEQTTQGELTEVLALFPGEWKAVGVTLPDNLEEGELRRILAGLLRMGRGVQWWIGDTIRFAQERFPDRYGVMLNATGYARQTLYNYASVARAFPISRRREMLPFGYHEAVARFKPEQQDFYLNLAERTEMTLKDLRALVKQDATPFDDSKQSVILPNAEGKGREDAPYEVDDGEEEEGAAIPVPPREPMALPAPLLSGVGQFFATEAVDGADSSGSVLAAVSQTETTEEAEEAGSAGQTPEKSRRVDPRDQMPSLRGGWRTLVRVLVEAALEDCGNALLNTPTQEVFQTGALRQQLEFAKRAFGYALTELDNLPTWETPEEQAAAMAAYDEQSRVDHPDEFCTHCFEIIPMDVLSGQLESEETRENGATLRRYDTGLGVYGMEEDEHESLICPACMSKPEKIFSLYSTTPFPPEEPQEMVVSSAHPFRVGQRVRSKREQDGRWVVGAVRKCEPQPGGWVKVFIDVDGADAADPPYWFRPEQLERLDGTPHREREAVAV